MSYRQPPPRGGRTTPLLDLHGLQRTDAIEAVTRFLEAHQAQRRQVCIVTGTGSHSQQGPVLRAAVEELLRRRQMEYERETPGSFLVRAGTGVVFERMACTNEDTKVVVQDRIEDPGGNFDLHSSLNRSTSLARNNATSTTNNNQLDELLRAPPLREVVEHDRECTRAREQSLEVHRNVLKENFQEKRELELALEVSRVAAEDEEKQEQHFSECLHRAVEESERSLAEADREEQELIERALRQSVVDHQQRQSNNDFLSQEELDRELQTALDLSVQHQNEEQSAREEEEEALKEVIALSLSN